MVSNNGIRLIGIHPADGAAALQGPITVILDNATNQDALVSAALIQWPDRTVIDVTGTHRLLASQAMRARWAARLDATAARPGLLIVASFSGAFDERQLTDFLFFVKHPVLGAA